MKTADVPALFVDASHTGADGFGVHLARLIRTVHSGSRIVGRDREALLSLLQQFQDKATIFKVARGCILADRVATIHSISTAIENGLLSPAEVAGMSTRARLDLLEYLRKREQDAIAEINYTAGFDQKSLVPDLSATAAQNLQAAQRADEISEVGTSDIPGTPRAREAMLQLVNALVSVVGAVDGSQKTEKSADSGSGKARRGKRRKG